MEQINKPTKKEIREYKSKRFYRAIKYLLFNKQDEFIEEFLT